MQPVTQEFLFQTVTLCLLLMQEQYISSVEQYISPQSESSQWPQHWSVQTTVVSAAFHDAVNTTCLLGDNNQSRRIDSPRWAQKCPAAPRSPRAAPS